MAGLLVGLAWLVVQWAILPNLERFRVPIEQQATRLAGVPVNIGAIRVTQRGWRPTVALDNVVLRDARQREALTLQRVTATLSLGSALSLTPQLDALAIDGAMLDVRRDAAGHVHVAGFNLSQSDGARGDTAGVDWFLRQPSFTIRGATVRWTDERRDAPPLALGDVALTLNNTRASHTVVLEATPPASWGDRFKLQGAFTQPAVTMRGLVAPSDWHTWSGTLQAHGPRVDVVELHRHVKLPFALTAGRGSLHATLTLQEGKLTHSQADVSLANVDVRLAPELKPLDISTLQGRVVAERQADATQVRVEGLTFTTAEGRTWPRADVQVTLQGAPTEPTGGALKAERIDLAMLALVATRLPLSTATRQLLTQIDPKGHAEAFEATWSGALDAPRQWRMRGQLRDVALQAQAVPLAADLIDQRLGRPGIEGAGMTFEATQAGGEASVTMRQGSLTFPGVFENPRLPVQHLQSSLSWTVTPGRKPQDPPVIAVQAKSLRFGNADVEGDLQGRWHTGAGRGVGIQGRFPGVLELNGTLARGRANAVARYLPLGIGPKVRHYVAEAFRDGTVDKASVHVRGDLWAFPFKDGSGDFKLDAQVSNVRLNVVPQAHREGGTAPLWPEFVQGQGRVSFDRTAMHIREARAEVLGVKLMQLEGSVVDFAHEPTLAITGLARGPLGMMLSYVDQSPISGWIGQALAQTQASGEGELKVALQVPLRNPAASTVRGELTLDGNDVRMNRDTPLLAQAKGQIVFTEKSLQISGARAQVFGGDAAFDGGTNAEGRLHFDGRGVITAEGFERAAELGSITRLARLMKGQAPYRLALTFRGAQPSFVVTSDLVGMAIEAPAPWGKAPSAALPLQVSTTWLPATPGGGDAPRRDVLRIRAGSMLEAHYVRDHGGEPGRGPRVVAGGIGVGPSTPAPQPDQGVHAVVQADHLDVDAWAAIAKRLDLDALAPPAVAATAGASTAEPVVDHGYAPSHVAVTANSVLLDARRMTKVTAGLSRDAQSADGAWRATLDADQLAGYAHWRPERPGSPAKLTARLARLTVPDSATASVDAMLTDDAPSNPPALDIVVEDFELKGRKMGRLEVDATHERPAARPGAAEAPQAAAPAHVWHLNRLRLTTPEAQFEGTGQWVSEAVASTPGSRERRRMVVDFMLRLQDSGAYLSRFGIDGVIRGGQGVVQGQVSWAGSPLAWHVPSLAGKVNLKVDDGQFLKANAGAARLLGILSLQSLPRRFLLDFRDVFSDGFSFDHVTGDLSVDRGMASTRNLRMRGVQASVLMEGRADILKETQDVDVWVVPEINAGAASLVYATINPAIGLGTFLAQWFLRRPLIEATTRQFHVSGPWGEPVVTPIVRKPGDRVPEVPDPPTEEDDEPGRTSSPNPARASTTPMTP